MIILNPLNWIEIKNIIKKYTIYLWDSIKSVEDKLWKPNFIKDNTYYYNKPDLALFWDMNNNIEYIEFSHENNNNIYLYNSIVFKTKADKLINNIESLWYKYIDNGYKKWYSFIFNELELSFRREFIPDDSNKNDSDSEKWLYFSTVWIWVKWYYSEFNLT